jgi:excisionase family DNA binding protein
MEEFFMRKVKLLTIKQAAEIVDGLTEYRIRQMCINGEIPCIMAGKKYLINERILLKTVGYSENDEK